MLCVSDGVAVGMTEPGARLQRTPSATRECNGLMEEESRSVSEQGPAVQHKECRPAAAGRAGQVEGVEEEPVKQSTRGDATGRSKPECLGLDHREASATCRTSGR